MKFSKLSLVGGLATLLMGATLLTSNAAQAADPTTQGTTQGTAGGSGTGNASVFNIADLKTLGSMGPLLCSGSPLVCNYDDDPAPNADNHFNVVPNLDDNPMQWVAKFVFINNPAGVLQIEKTISSVGLDAAGTKVVFDDNQPGTNIRTGQACLDLLGSDTTVGSVANGLISTGQKTAAELMAVRNGCQQGDVGILVNPFPVSKHLPPGIYKQCAVLAQVGGAASPTYCEYFKILPITGFQTDVDVVSYGNLVQFVKSIFPGNFSLEPLTSGPDINPGTIQGFGNTSPKLLVAFTWMVNDYNNTPNDPSDDKYIKSWFDVQINRKDTAGNIIATQHVDNIPGGATATAFGPDADLTTGVSTGVAPFVPICLEPNESLKLDFSVTPQEVLFPGTYTGKVRLTVTNTGVPASCTPTLGSGESATGDSNGEYNNLPGTLVAQAYP